MTRVELRHTVLLAVISGGHLHKVAYDPDRLLVEARLPEEATDSLTRAVDAVMESIPIDEDDY